MFVLLILIITFNYINKYKHASQFLSVMQYWYPTIQLSDEVCYLKGPGGGMAPPLPPATDAHGLTTFLVVSLNHSFCNSMFCICAYINKCLKFIFQILKLQQTNAPEL